MLDEFSGVYAGELHQIAKDVPLEGSTPYRLSDGRVIEIIFSDGPSVLCRRLLPFQDRFIDLGWLYETVDAFIAKMRSWERQNRNDQRNHGHIFSDMLPDSRNFLTALPSLLERLTTDLKIPERVLTGSIDSLKYLNRPIKQLDPGDVWDAAELLGAVFAYVGEVLRIATNGQWHLHLFKPKPIWRQADITLDPEAAVRAGLPANLEALLRGGIKSCSIEQLQEAGVIQVSVLQMEPQIDTPEIWEPRIIAGNGRKLNFAVELAVWLAEHSKTPDLAMWARTTLYRTGYRGAFKVFLLIETDLPVMIVRFWHPMGQSPGSGASIWAACILRGQYQANIPRTPRV